jgi:hypothetical protein
MIHPAMMREPSKTLRARVTPEEVFTERIAKSRNAESTDRGDQKATPTNDEWVNNGGAKRAANVVKEENDFADG